MKRGLILLVFLLVLSVQFASASLSSTFDSVQDYVNDYSSGKISAPQLIVYLEYVKNKMYEDLDKEKRQSFTKSEISQILDKVEKDENNKDYQYKSAEYEKKFKTDEFEIVFEAYPEYVRSVDYYERRDDSSEKVYRLEYNIVAKDSTKDQSISDEIIDVKEDIEELVNSGSESEEEYFATQESLSKVKSKLWNIRNLETCIQIFTDAGFTEQEKDYPSKEKAFYLTIKETKEEKCWNDGGSCEQKCEEVEVCDSATTASTSESSSCEQKCEDVEKCEDVTAEDGSISQSCETSNVCEEVCPTTTSTENCHMEKKCDQDCDTGKETCTENIMGQIRLDGNCREDGSDLWLNSWSNNEEFKYFQGLNEGNSWNCDNEVEKLVAVRAVLQEGLDDDFVKWYFEDFIKKDYDYMLNGGDGLREVLYKLVQNEEEISNRIQCSDSKEWPDGFEKIDLTYKTDSINLEVWEKMIPVEWSEEPYYTTLFKYSFIPDKQTLEELIQYKLSQTDNLGPSAEEISQIKSDEGRMEIVKRLSEKYGGSLDVKLELIEADESIVLKYLTINENQVLRISDDVPEKTDITLEVDYDTLYNFINYMSNTMEKDRIYGPHWVQVSDQDGLGKFLGVVGAVSKMWREGVNIKPRYALIKMFFSTKDIIELMKSEEVSSTDISIDETQTTKMTGEAIITRT